MGIRQVWRIGIVSLLAAGLLWHTLSQPNALNQVQAAPAWDIAPDTAQQDATPTPVLATVAVERAIVFPQPDRTAEPLTYLYERERVPVYGQSPDGAFLFVPVGNLWGWIIAAQVDLEGDLATIPIIEQTAPLATPTMTITPFQATPVPTVNSTFPTHTPLPTQTPAATTPADSAANSAADDTDEMPLLPGVPPPIAITLPDNWQAADLVVPFQTFDGEIHDAPLTIYFGQLAPDVTAFIYLYWGFPNTIDYITGEYNLWADGVQILRGSLLGDSCNIGLYDQHMYEVGGVEGIGAPYQAADCEDEADTAGWFSVMRVQDGTFAFFVAVEPWDARDPYQATLQAILDTVVFFPPDED
ncbi:MAG: hypothetical protein JXA10_06505 [Anaerolineae bacterium]|nr:hypothetical protein [Anaerolineae bacterium]